MSLTEPTAPRTKRSYNRRAPVRTEEVRTEPVREDVRPRKTRTRKGNVDQLHVPAELIPSGMDYQWVTDSVLGRPEPQVRMGFEANGWEAVPTNRHDGMFMPKGHQGEINVGGLVLCERPLELTLEARAEDSHAARQALRTQEQKLRAGNLDGVTLDTQHPTARANTRLTRELVSGMPVPRD